MKKAFKLWFHIAGVKFLVVFVDFLLFNDLTIFKCKDYGLEKTVVNTVKRVTKIKDGCYWVLGDNLDYSPDSRKFGFLLPR